MTKTEEEVLVNALVDIINIERDLEKAKIDLALREDFNLIDAFGLLDH